MIFNLPVRTDLPENVTPIDAIAVVKALDEHGEPTIFLASTEHLSNWEAIGLLTCALDVNRASMTEAFLPDDEADDA